MQYNIINALCQLPANDGNFASTLRDANVNQIKEAISVMENRDGKDKGRIETCKRELRKRKE